MPIRALHLHPTLHHRPLQNLFGSAIMFLLTCDDHGKIRLEGPFYPPNIPPYAILSHTWGDQEVLFQDMRDETGRSKQGYFKIELCVQQAKRDGLDYSWVDTCCIDKSSSAELQSAITSMFRWYSSAKRCYVFMRVPCLDPTLGFGVDTDALTYAGPMSLPMLMTGRFKRAGGLPEDGRSRNYLRPHPSSSSTATGIGLATKAMLRSRL